MTATDKARLAELETTLTFKEEVLNRFLSIKQADGTTGGKLRSIFFRALRLHRAKIAQLIRERNDLLSVRQSE